MHCAFTKFFEIMGNFKTSVDAFQYITSLINFLLGLITFGYTDVYLLSIL